MTKRRPHMSAEARAESYRLVGLKLRVPKSHGALVGGVVTPEYEAWCGMKRRCLRPARHNAARYVGRGIAVSPLWQEDFAAFLEHIGPRPSAKHSLDRIDNDRGYEPGNVRWATLEEQANNKARSLAVEVNGERLSLAQWARRLGCDAKALYARYYRGIRDPEKLLAPVRAMRPMQRRKSPPQSPER